MSFYVRGGVYCDTNFAEVEPGTDESYGPFDTREEAEKVWSGKARANIDTCCHRLVIVEQ
jgi:hypothetical protein